MGEKPLSNLDENRKTRAKTGGRKKGSLNKATADVKAHAQKYTTEAVETLAKLMRSAESETARAAACQQILDRGHGKPAQAHTGEGGGPIALGISWLPPSA